MAFYSPVPAPQHPRALPGQLWEWAAVGQLRDSCLLSRNKAVVFGSPAFADVALPGVSAGLGSSPTAAQGIPATGCVVPMQPRGT